MGVLLAGLSALLYGSADFAGGYASRRASAMSVVVVSQIFGVLTALAAAPFIRSTTVSAYDLLWGGIAGIGGAFGLIALYRGIAGSIVAIVSPTAALLGAAFPIVFGAIVGEHPSTLTWIGILLCLPAVVALSLGGRVAGDTRRVLTSFLFGTIAGIGFACFYIAISRPSQEAGLWPLVAARGVSVLLVAVVALARRQNPFAAGGRIGIVVLAGIFDMGANIAFVVSTRYSLLAVATVLASLYPAPTVLLGRIVFREKVGVVRLVGFAFALAGTAMIGVGTL